MIRIDQGVCQDVNQARNLEWLETNGIGGFASSTIIGLNTRRYHGLLIAALPAPLGRVVMLSHVAEQVRLPDGRCVEIGGRERSGYAPDAHGSLAATFVGHDLVKPGSEAIRISTLGKRPEGAYERRLQRLIGIVVTPEHPHGEADVRVLVASNEQCICVDVAAEHVRDEVGIRALCHVSRLRYPPST